MVPYRLGEKGGNYQKTLTISELPSHNHSGQGLTASIGCNEEDADSEEAAGRTFGNTEANFYNSSPNDNSMAANAVTVGGQTANTGGQLPFNTMNPYQGVNFIIALQGVYPSRN